MRQTVLIDSSEDLETYIYSDGIIIVPTSAIITIYKPGTGTKLIDDAAMTIDGNGKLSYSLTPALTDTIDENYKAVITYIHETKPFLFNYFYDVVISKFVSVIVDQDLFAELPQLKSNSWKVMGSAESGSSTSIVDSNLQDYADNYFNGGTAYFIDQDELREVADFVSSTGTVTVVPFSTAILPESKYILTRTFTNEIQRAFEKIEELLRNEGRRGYLILDPYDLKEVHLCFAVAEALKGLSFEEEGYWWKMWKEYEKMSFAKFKSLNLKYDETEDGIISEPEEKTQLGIKTIRRG